MMNNLLTASIGKNDKMLKEFDGQIYVSGWMQKATKCLEEIMNLENKTFLYLSDKPYATVRLRVPVLVS